MRKEIKKINNLSRKRAIEFAYKTAFESEAKSTSCAQATFHAITSVFGYKNPMFLEVYLL